MIYTNPPVVSYTVTSTSGLTYAFNFEYLRLAFVHVTVNNETPAEGDYTIEAHSVVFEEDVLEVGDVIYIYRSTPTTPLVDWSDASVLHAAEMTVQQVQTIHILEEVEYTMLNEAMVTNTSGNWEGLNKRINNLANPVANQDAVTKKYMEDSMTSYEETCQAYATAAANSATSASTSATSASTSASNASASATSASTSASTASTASATATAAKVDAVAAKNAAVSAKDSAESAQEAAETAQEAAEESETNAQTYATNANTSAVNAGNSQVAAANSAVNASGYATQAGNYATQAATSAAAAQAVVWKGTLAEYNALTVINPDTLYFVQIENI